MRTRKTVIILISGKAGSGKTTAAEILNKKLVELGLDTVLYGFANPIKYIAKSFAGWDGNKDEKGRKLLQKIGQTFRDYDENIWVKHLLNQIDRRSNLLPKNFVLVSDWRFPNELAYLKNNPLLDVVTIRVFGRGGLNGETALDVSENSLPEIDVEFIPTHLEGDHWYDFQIQNSIDNIEHLEIKLDLVLAEIRKQYIVE